MSMKRSRAKSYTSRRQDTSPTGTRRTLKKAKEKTWDEYVADKPDQEFVSYSMKDRYDVGTLLLHTKFGKGAVVHVEDTRMDVLFSDAKRKLGHNLV